MSQVYQFIADEKFVDDLDASRLLQQAAGNVLSVTPTVAVDLIGRYARVDMVTLCMALSIAYDMGLQAAAKQAQP